MYLQLSQEKEKQTNKNRSKKKRKEGREGRSEGKRKEGRAKLRNLSRKELGNEHWYVEYFNKIYEAS